MSANPVYFTSIPLPKSAVSGRLFRWSMPRENDVNNMKTLGVTHVLVCCSRHEVEHLMPLYESSGFKVLHLEIEDFSVPDMTIAKQKILEAETVLTNGGTVLAHCMGGRGRTGLVLACVIGDLERMAARESIAYLREFFPAVETREQSAFVARYLTLRDDEAAAAQTTTTSESSSSSSTVGAVSAPIAVPTASK